MPALKTNCSCQIGCALDVSFGRVWCVCIAYDTCQHSGTRRVNAACYMRGNAACREGSVDGVEQRNGLVEECLGEEAAPAAVLDGERASLLDRDHQSRQCRRRRHWPRLRRCTQCSTFVATVSVCTHADGALHCTA